MKRPALVLSFVLVGLFAAGCATTQVTTDGSAEHAGRVMKPRRIVVYPFAATPADLPPQERAEYASYSSGGSADQIRVGRQLGAKVAERLVEEINDMGIKAVVGTSSTQAALDDVLIYGHFESVDEGSGVERALIGFGSGKAELKTVVTAYQQTNYGLKRVGGGSVDSGGGKGPGLFVPIIVTAATANPVGLIVGAAAKIEGEASGRTTIDGAAKRTADAIAERVEERFKKEGWI